jgi:biotin carboxyl carrier protein
MANIIVNKDKIFELKEENDKKVLNGKSIEADIRQVGPEQYHILYNGKSYNAELLEAEGKKKLKIRINGKTAEVVVKDDNDLILEKMGLSGTSISKIQEIKAPMPGLILDIKVSEGSQVKTGDPLLVLEAMKMENIIKSPCDGQVERILSKKGEIVEKNKLLIKFK